MLSLALVALFSRLFLLSEAAQDPDAFMTAMELIRYWGYPAEHHEVHTADGYILNIHRIRHGRFSETNTSCNRPAILLVHGLGASATEFLLNPPESCPAFLLADAGFDVFLMNHRGTTVDEMSKYDTPAVIDKVLEISGENGTYWVGHSQGTAMGHMTLADHPEYNKKVRALFQLAPAGSGGYAKGLIQILFWAYNNLRPIHEFYRVALGSHEISFQLSFIYRPLVRLCNLISFGDQICDSATHLLFGPSTRTLNMLAARKKVEHMDHNPLENIQRYGTEVPTPYDYTNIDVPLYHFWSKSDWLGAPEDIEHVIMKMIRPEILKGSFEIEGYNHIDFVVATDCAETVFNPIAKIVRGENANMCEK